MAHNITAEALQERVEALEKQIEIYRALVEDSPDLFYRTDLEGRIIYISPSVQRLSGYTTAEAIGMKMAEEVYLNPEERRDFLQQLQETGRVENFQARLKRKDGTIWWAATNAHFFRDPQGRPLGVEGITRDITDLKVAEAALKDSEGRFRTAFHTSPDAINLNRATDGMFVDINEGFSKTMGFTRQDVDGKTSLELNIWRNPDDRQRLVDALSQNGQVDNLEAEFVAKDGTVIVGLMSARLIQINTEPMILSITRDITEHRRMERQLQQAHKFEALGTLAGGIAHDFNNLLMGIQGRASLLSVGLETENALNEHVRGIEAYVDSATNLTRQLLGFARGGKYEVKPIDINALLQSSAAMFGRTRKEIRIHTRTDNASTVVEADRQQLEQVLLNLYVNAWQAMPDGGELYLETTALVLDESFCQTHHIAPGGYCKLSVTDTGSGMDEATRQRAFDPFFTTKEMSRGTGLGLASALGIVKNHGGTITIYSEVGLGTTFNIYLPLSEKRPHQAMPEVAGIIRGSETILLVDDEEMVIEVGQAMLEALGYRVLTASSGQAALEVLDQETISIDLIILDMVMPGMDGGKTFDRIRQIRPDTPVMLSSGYSINGQASNIISRGCNGFIQKPFNIADLSQKLRDILDTAGGNRPC